MRHECLAPRAPHRSGPHLLIALLAVATVSLVARAACAGPNANAKLLIHLTRVDKVSNPCGHPGLRPPCSGIVTAGRSDQLYYWCPLLVTDGDATAGVGAMECGIQYGTSATDGIYVSWTLICASAEFPTAGPHGPWPAPGSGNRIVWDAATNCQRYEPGGPGTGVVAIAGSFYLAPYGPTRVEITPHPATGQARVASCDGRVDIVAGAGITPPLSHLGAVVFSADGSTPGYNPCGLVTPVAGTTWSRVKAAYR